MAGDGLPRTVGHPGAVPPSRPPVLTSPRTALARPSVPGRRARCQRCCSWRTPRPGDLGRARPGQSRSVTAPGPWDLPEPRAGIDRELSADRFLGCHDSRRLVPRPPADPRNQVRRAVPGQTACAVRLATARRRLPVVRRHRAGRSHPLRPLPRCSPGGCRTSRGGPCAPGRTRTCGTRFRKPLLYPLSYGGSWPGGPRAAPGEEAWRCYRAPGHRTGATPRPRACAPGLRPSWPGPAPPMLTGALSREDTGATPHRGSSRGLDSRRVTVVGGGSSGHAIDPDDSRGPVGEVRAVRLRAPRAAGRRRYRGTRPRWRRAQGERLSKSSVSGRTARTFSPRVRLRYASPSFLMVRSRCSTRCAPQSQTTSLLHAAAEGAVLDLGNDGPRHGTVLAGRHRSLRTWRTVTLCRRACDPMPA